VTDVKAWKFLNPVGRGGQASVVIAESQEQAAQRLQLYAEQQDLDGAWIDTADVIEVPIDRTTVIIWISI